MNGDARDADIFYFDVYNEGSLNIGKDIITDFEAGIDTLQLADLSATQHVHVDQVQSDAVITIDGILGSITLLNTHAADVHWLV